MTRILAIDPGSTESGWCVIDAETRQPLHHGKHGNEMLTGLVRNGSSIGDPDTLVIEMIASYGMAVGKEVFETCVWIGRFLEAAEDNPWLFRRSREFRREVKLHHCMSAKAKDTNIRQALVDRFAPGEPNHGKGTKAEPGWFHGFAADVWAAYALAVMVADRLNPDGAP